MSLERLRLTAVDGMRLAALSPISLSMHDTDRLRTAAAWRPAAVEVMLIVLLGFWKFDMHYQILRRPLHSLMCSPDYCFVVF